MHGLYNISSFSTTDPAGMGNIRVMFAQTGKVLQDQSYYPFGMTMGSSLTFQVEDQLPDNKYKYNGNPDGDRGQDDFGLNWYDYGTRMYDPTIGRWNGNDAHAENYFSLSSYNYGLNNPIRMIDPDGMDARLYDIDEWNAFSMDEYGNITLYGSSSGQGNDKTKGKTSKKGNDKKDDNSENNPNQGDPIKDHLLDVAAGNAPGNTFGSQVIGASYGNSGGGASSGVTANGGDALDPSTIGQNLPLIGGRSTYAGGDNPMTYSGKYTYSYVPTMLTDYPAIGHDRRYDNLGVFGVSGLLFDTRAIGADWRFVGEQLILMSLPLDYETRINAGILGFGLGAAALPKTILQLAKPNGFGEIMMWYYISNYGVTNKPGN